MSNSNTHECGCAQGLPTSTLWIDVLKWCICILSNDDEDMSFLASLFSYAHYHGGLSEKQERAARTIIRRIKAERGL